MAMAPLLSLPLLLLLASTSAVVAAEKQRLQYVNYAQLQAPPTPTTPVTTPPTTPVTKPPPLPPTTPATKPPSPPVVGPPPTPAPYRPPVKKEECGALCEARCSLHSRKGLCLRACSTCCVRCKCVPPGTYGNRELCGKCYTDMRTHGNRFKCP